METNKFSGFTKLYPLSKTLSLEDVCVYSATLISTIVDWSNLMVFDNGVYSVTLISTIIDCF